MLCTKIRQRTAAPQLLENSPAPCNPLLNKAGERRCSQSYKTAMINFTLSQKFTVSLKERRKTIVLLNTEHPFGQGLESVVEVDGVVFPQT